MKKVSQTLPRKKQFIVATDETVSACIDRMDREGYAPIRRIEKPVFRETANGPEPSGRECIIEGILKILK
ncbi:NETI motif-containing protein [Sporolactobacillus spathodeae]|uniref:NETI motif-containing protein n=1 Tax=Sporolactobacillus spathodeae TaxID=1465502 RepID=A0ABS2Q720_9BACL|nr:hypothetical protein [Sporolactobacillus spathodeae]